MFLYQALFIVLSFVPGASGLPLLGCSFVTASSPDLTGLALDTPPPMNPDFFPYHAPRTKHSVWSGYRAKPQPDYRKQPGQGLLPARIFLRRCAGISQRLFACGVKPVMCLLRERPMDILAGLPRSQPALDRWPDAAP